MIDYCCLGVEDALTGLFDFFVIGHPIQSALQIIPHPRPITMQSIQISARWMIQSAAPSYARAVSPGRSQPHVIRFLTAAAKLHLHAQGDL
jgi:hypothetical protein